MTSGPNKVSAKVQIIREHASDNVTSVSQIVELLSFDIDTQKATGMDLFSKLSAVDIL